MQNIYSVVFTNLVAAGRVASDWCANLGGTSCMSCLVLAATSCMTCLVLAEWHASGVVSNIRVCSLKDHFLFL
jgi:hypothetical protein